MSERHRDARPAKKLAGPLPERIDGTLLDYHALVDRVAELAPRFRRAKPFPHVVVDDFLPPDTLEKILRSLPTPGDPDIHWGDVNTNLDDGRPAQKGKHHLPNVLYMKAVLRTLFYELNGIHFLAWLRQVTGIPKLLPDPQLQGGGVHMVGRGGLLRVHADFNKHPVFDMDRRLNLLLYLNPDWDEAWGGHLELWDPTMTECHDRIAPVANRCVIFATTSRSFHGHPHPLACPPDRVRTSAALYYYTIGRPENEATDRHGTLWQDLPTESKP